MSDNEFNGKEIKNNALKITFKKGKKSWFLLVVICFIFSFLGVSNSDLTSFIGAADSYLGLNVSYIPENISVINDYIINTSFVGKIPFISEKVIKNFTNLLAYNYSWVINLLALNFAYFQRNTGEVIVYLLLVALISSLIKIFIQNAFNVGKARYTMENRFNKEVEIRRIFSPFHKDNFLHIVWIGFLYRLSFFLWSLTIVGFFYKYYQYKVIPYLIAENPNISWKDAKRMSKKMTDGYKWKMFLTSLSCFYIFILRIFPGIGLLVSAPFEESLNTEYYFYLRKKIKDENEIFIERAFDTEIYPNSEEQNYLLRNVALNLSEINKAKKHYDFYDYVFFFFAFSMIGYLWEIFFVFAKNRVLANRGIMYGPWLPIYGFGGTFIVMLLDKFKTNRFKLFFSAVGLCAILEYLASWILDYFYNSSYWNYDNEFLNINGRICFEGLIGFGLAGMLAVYVVAPRLSVFLDKIGKNKTKILCLVLFILFFIDMVCCSIFGFNSGNGIGGKI